MLPVLGFAAAVLIGCGGGGNDRVSSSSLSPRLVPANSVPGFTLERTLDWTDPVNLVGEGIQLPAATHPSAAVKEFNDSHFEGAAGEVLRKGNGLDATEAKVGVAKFGSAADAAKVRDWMHSQDMQQPCFSECIFSPLTVPLSNMPGSRFVVQTSSVPLPPAGVPAAVAKKIKAANPGARQGPTNYLGEFTIGPYLYWLALQTDPNATATVEQGMKGYYDHAKSRGT